MIKDTLVAVADDTVMRIRCYPPAGRAFVTLMQSDDASAFVAHKIAIVIDAQKANEIATQFLMLAKEMEAKS